MLAVLAVHLVLVLVAMLPMAVPMAVPVLRMPVLMIVMPMAIPRKPFDGLLLNQRAINMRQALVDQRNRVFTVVRFYLNK